MPPENQPDIPVTADAGDRLLSSLIGFLKDSYVFPDRVPAMQKALRAHLHRNEYGSFRSARALLERLNADIQEATHDRHLRVIYRAEALPANDPAPTAQDAAAQAARDAEQNYGFRKSERLDGNVGYLDIGFFPYAAEAGETVVDAMGFVAHTRALILDLRDNAGGDPATVALLLSYLFGPEPVHLNDIYWRPDDSTGQFWTQPYVVGHRYTGPVYVLTSGNTFSGGEELAYDLQAQHRATIIGEPTAGGAHPISIHRPDPPSLRDHFLVLIPSGRAINPVTHTDWEGRGVQPDVAVPADQALARAIQLATASTGHSQTDASKP